ncbi:MAG: TrkA C-terminal domain-containing protein [Candidatus Omnitrophota bacterium]
MNLLLFIIILIVSFIVVRIGAIAFELTGLEWSLAKFQALSCFTGTGFTTKEAELITGNTQRRRIASVLIVLGHAGFVTLIATFANSLRTDEVMPKSVVPFLHSVIPSHLVPWINLAVIAFVMYSLYKIFTHTKFAGKLTEALKTRIVKREIIKPVTFEELMVLTGGYGVSSAEIRNDSPILNKAIIETNLRSYDITILVIERNGETIPNPSADTKILLGDRVICFGRLGNIRKQLSVTPQ